MTVSDAITFGKAKLAQIEAVGTKEDEETAEFIQLALTAIHYMIFQESRIQDCSGGPIIGTIDQIDQID